MQNRRTKRTTKEKCEEKRKIRVIHVYPNWTKEQNHMGNHMVPSKIWQERETKGAELERKKKRDIHSKVHQRFHTCTLFHKGSDRFHRGLLEVIPVIIDRGLMDLVGV